MFRFGGNTVRTLPFYTSRFQQLNNSRRLFKIGSIYICLPLKKKKDHKASAWKMLFSQKNCIRL